MQGGLFFGEAELSPLRDRHNEGRHRLLGVVKQAGGLLVLLQRLVEPLDRKALEGCDWLAFDVLALEVQGGGPRGGLEGQRDRLGKD